MLTRYFTKFHQLHTLETPGLNYRLSSTVEAATAVVFGQDPHTENISFDLLYSVFHITFTYSHQLCFAQEYLTVTGIADVIRNFGIVCALFQIDKIL